MDHAIRDVNPIFGAPPEIARPIAEGLAFMATVHEEIGRPLEPGFVADFLVDTRRAAERSRPRQRIVKSSGGMRFILLDHPRRAMGLGPRWNPPPSWCPWTRAGANIFSRAADSVSEWFSDAADNTSKEVKRWDESGKLRVVGGWAARVGSVVLSAVATYYTGGATAPLLVSSLNVLMTDPATTTWEDDVTGFVMAGQVLPPSDRPPELEKYQDVTDQVNANLWDLPPEQRDEILNRGESYLLSLAAKQGPEAVETMKEAIADYKRRGLAGDFSLGALALPEKEKWYQTYQEEIGFGLMLGGLTIGGVTLWYILS